MTDRNGRWRIVVTGLVLAATAGSAIVGRDAVVSTAAPGPSGLAVHSFSADRADPDRWTDRDGMALYADLDLGAPEETGDANALANSHNPARPAVYPYDQTFRLHSLPGATKTAYLDFDGTTVANSAWNTSFTNGAPFSVGGYDVDGNPASFSTAELDAIQEIWQRVSEDFATLQVDVTTEEPALARIDRSSTSDSEFGVRLVVTNTTMVYSSCACGGVSYVGSFNYVNAGDPSRSHEYYQPSYVFQNGVGTSPKTVAEAASHEIGHSLGLSHDTNASSGGYTGQGAWAPIMGTGYSRPITQWSKGEYDGALNLEDDFAVMQAHGVPVIPDDVSGVPAGASSLGAEGGTIDAVISTASDVDVFGFTTAGGPVRITGTPAPVSPDLDLSVTLLDASGGVITSADPPAAFVSEDFADGMAATIRTTLGAGQYYVRVDGVGAGTSSTGYTDYASVGRYRISVAAGASLNTVPIAAAAASTTVGRGPLTVTFSSNGSSDSDGQVVAYWWDFGDGGTSSEPNPTHTFEAVGDYSVTLTVTDDAGGTATTAVAVSATRMGNRISSLELSLLPRSSTKRYAVATVSAVSPTGGPLGRALVLGAWSGSDKRWVLGITDENGNVTFESSSAKKAKASYGFAVLWAGYLEAPNDWSAEATTSANVWNGGPNYWASASPS